MLTGITKCLKKQLNEDIDKKIEYLIKEIERKTKETKLKVGGPLGIINKNREISKLQMELKKCKDKKNKETIKNSKSYKGSLASSCRISDSGPVTLSFF